MTTSLMKNLPSLLVGFEDIISELQNFGIDATTSLATKYPPHNIFTPCSITSDEENPKIYYIELAVAGFSKDEIKVKHNLKNNQLEITGEKDLEFNSSVAANTYYHHGIAKRNFTKIFTLDKDLEVAETTLVDGILKIKIKRNVQKEEEVSKYLKIN